MKQPIPIVKSSKSNHQKEKKLSNSGINRTPNQLKHHNQADKDPSSYFYDYS